jgi:L-threonylcarbamoyladenylate synthase
MMKTSGYDEALSRLMAGGVGVLPTDTVYGLVARAADPAAVARLYALKSRDHKPGTVIAASVEQLVELGVPESALRRVERWWPASLSVVVPCGDNLAYLHAGLDSLPVRIPKDARVQEFLQQSGPLATSSANQPGEPPAVNIQEAWNYFGEPVDFYVDGGDLSGRAPSTIIRLNEDGVEILRQGAVNVDELAS